MMEEWKPWTVRVETTSIIRDGQVLYNISTPRLTSAWWDKVEELRAIKAFDNAIQVVEK